ncbi:molybdate ABC transporter substrate-binding protein [Salibacterium salarium]|uniref:molybdate ABC transporter substrate-binding protein n=1 Tax=Salibacterium salarium TaxID=284579 RepID=UPI0027D8E36E|nr:molybdate ABC transporter substrate-binding protein [Salibacterium salarium]
MRPNKILYFTEIMAVFSIITGCSLFEDSSTKDMTIRISAASSLQDVMGEVETIIETRHPTMDVVFNYGSSGSLKQQLSQGAPIDLYLSASTDTVHALLEDGTLKEKNVVNFLQNELVLIEPVNNDSYIEKVEDITDERFEKIAIGTPESVPAGKYAVETLKNINVFQDVSPHFIQAKNVRQVLTYVENENVDAGFVYKTDAKLSDEVNIATEVDNNYHSPIIYPAAMTNRGAENDEVQALFNFFQSEEFKNIAEEYGFKAQVGSN